MPCPLRARSDSDPGYLTVTDGQSAARADLKLSSLRRRRLRPPKQRVLPDWDACLIGEPNRNAYGRLWTR
jgi:hypothetical protein